MHRARHVGETRAVEPRTDTHTQRSSSVRESGGARASTESKMKPPSVRVGAVRADELQVEAVRGAEIGCALPVSDHWALHRQDDLS